MSDWTTNTTHRIGRNIAAARKRKGMSAQAVADTCTQHGVPMKRTTLANLENGRRDTIAVTDLLAIAAALGVPPVALLYPADQAGAEVELVPGTTVAMFDALTLFTGEAAPTADQPDQEVSLLTNLRAIRAAESQARRFLGQAINNPSNTALRESLEGHAVWALREALPYREACERVMSHPLPIPADLGDLYARAQRERSTTPGAL